MTLSAATLFGAGVDGKWVATLETPRGEMKLNFDFKTDGAKLTGTVTNQMGESEIRDGKIDGDTIEFKQVMQFGERELRFAYMGKLSGNEIAFTRKLDGPAAGGRGEGKGGRKGGFGGPQEFKALREK